VHKEAGAEEEEEPNSQFFSDEYAAPTLFIGFACSKVV
jgi:hypothetical protein